MFTLEKIFSFEAAHLLPFHDGKCQRLHGHSWKLSVYVQQENLILDGAKQGMAIDYADISKVVKPIIEEYLDHYYLNDSLKLESPTSENIAKWLYDKIEPLLPNLYAIGIHETCTSSCLYVRPTTEQRPFDYGTQSILGQPNQQ